MALLFTFDVLLAIISFTVCSIDITTDSTPLIERGACISNPCLHGGLCSVTPSGFICTCMNGYIGVNCEKRANDCPRDNSIDCVHGICKLDFNGFPRCICNDGYEGPDCSIQTDNCALKPCRNHAKCVDKLHGYECQCLKGTSGTHCQIKESEIHKCINKCDGYLLDGKCWHEQVQNITVGWGYGDFICNTKETCFNMSSSNEITDKFELMEVQLKPVHMQYTDDLIFITDRDAILYDYHFVPHILPMEAQSEESFLKCNTTNAIPLTKNPQVSHLNVNESLLRIGTQYFIADMNALHRCVFGLRLNVTVKTKDCIDPAAPDGSICNERGKCFSDFTKPMYQCLCCEGYTGYYCEYEDPCFVNPCTNGGKCQIEDYGAGVLKHKCICPNGYYGSRCHKIVDYCSHNPCKNEGACYTKVHGYTCKCKIGYSGENCQINLDECQPNPCLNNGTCVDGLASFHCQCRDGYKGTLCEVNVNDCASSPCNNGTCLDLVNKYTCACPPGMTGHNCEVKLDECTSQPCLNGKCVTEEDGFSCSCGIGFTGMLCEIKLDLCLHSKYCITDHASACVDRGNEVTCQCSSGWTGDNCGVNINECIDHKCQNGGHCIDKVNGYECKCKKKFFGLYCEISPPKVVPDIEINFMADNCKKFKNPQGLQHLEHNIIAILAKACKCPLSVKSLKVGSTRVICKDEMAGSFMTDLAADDVMLQKQIVCGMDHMIKTESTPNIFHTRLDHNTYLVSIIDNAELCSLKSVFNVTKASSNDSSMIGVIIGIVSGFVVLIAGIFFISARVRSSRMKVGVTHKFEKETVSFDNAAYTKDADESFDAAETSFNSNNSTEECPKWAKGYDRARQLYERNRNVPAGRLFDFHNPGGETSQI